MARRALILLTAALHAQQPGFEHLYRKALTQREQTLGRDAAKTRESARDLALYLAGRGEFDKAEAYREEAITLVDSAEGATVLHNWAVSLEDRDVPAAERIYRRVLEIRTRMLHPLDVELAATRLNLASLLVARGEPEAGKLASAALIAFEKKLGPLDARVGAACGVLGAAHAIKGDIVTAERLFRRGLAIAEKAHGATAPQTASALENLADLLAQTGRESAARPLLDRAQKIRAGTR